MCGIVGYAGHREAVGVLLDGLRRLEYRGYDSAGLAVQVEGRLEIRRATGRIGQLSNLVEREPMRGSTGLGHTRWATHGRPSDANAHPHADCTATLAIVHNGIIENYRELRKSLVGEGHRFRSQTDTEVIAQLLERYRAGGLVKAVRRAAGHLR